MGHVTEHARLDASEDMPPSPSDHAVTAKRAQKRGCKRSTPPSPSDRGSIHGHRGARTQAKHSPSPSDHAATAERARKQGTPPSPSDRGSIHGHCGARTQARHAAFSERPRGHSNARTQAKRTQPATAHGRGHAMEARTRARNPSQLEAKPAASCQTRDERRGTRRRLLHLCRRDDLMKLRRMATR